MLLRVSLQKECFFSILQAKIVTGPLGFLHGWDAPGVRSCVAAALQLQTCTVIIEEAMV